MSLSDGMVGAGSHDVVMHQSERLPLRAAAEVQDDLLVSSNDLDRLYRLLADASESLIKHFHAASAELGAAVNAMAAHPEIDLPELHRGVAHVAGAITSIQFGDLATQLIAHTAARLRHCADRLARDAIVDDEDGTAAVADALARPNPVTQDEMDAGSVELF